MWLSTVGPLTQGSARHAIADYDGIAGRLPEYWGEDADVWNPMRFVDGRVDKETKLGLYANLWANFPLPSSLSCEWQ